MFLFFKRLKVLVFILIMVEASFFCSWRLKVLVFAFKKVEGFCFFF
jgi:hypothetical protein